MYIAKAIIYILTEDELNDLLKQVEETSGRKPSKVDGGEDNIWFAVIDGDDFIVYKNYSSALLNHDDLIVCNDYSNSSLFVELAQMDEDNGETLWVKHGDNICKGWMNLPKECLTNENFPKINQLSPWEVSHLVKNKTIKL